MAVHPANIIQECDGILGHAARPTHAMNDTMEEVISTLRVWPSWRGAISYTTIVEDEHRILGIATKVLNLALPSKRAAIKPVAKRCTQS